MKKLKYSILFFLMFSIFLSLFPQKISQSKSVKKQHVLILNSYHHGYEWSDSIVDGILKVLEKYNTNTDISIEYMDTKRISGGQYFEQLYSIYKYKYQNYKVDVIVACDNDAYDFILKYRDSLFPNTPVVFCGVNNFSKDTLSGHKLITGVAENPNIKSTIDIALRLHPNTRNLAVITDKTSTSRALKSILNGIIDEYKKNINVIYIEDINISDVQKKILQLPSNSIILLMAPIFKDRSGEFISVTEGSRLISETSRIPLYGFWDFYIDHGIVGGMLTSGYDQGKQAGELTLKILNGISADDIAIKDDYASNKLVFDYKKLKYYGINTYILPRGSTVINAPPKSYSINKHLLWLSIAIVFCVLLIIVVSLSMSIKKLKHAEAALKESEDRYRRLIEFLPDAVFVSNNGTSLFSNASGLKLLGLNDLKELVGNNIMQYIHPDFQNLYYERVDNLSLDNKISPPVEYKFFRKDGTEIYVEASSIAFLWDGNPSSLVVARDITERKQAEQLKIKLEESKRLLRETVELEKMKTEFFANISHELRTPLNVVLSSAQMFEYLNNSGTNNESTDKNKKYIYMMKQNCYRLVRLVDNLIDMTKIDAGYFQLYPRNVDLISLIENITDSVADYIEQKGITLIFDTDTEEKVIACDPDKIERIILNLLSNATKFTDKGGAILVNIYDKVDKVIVSIKDTGIGIPKEKQEMIFERFIQVDKSLARNHEGSGIGLSIVKSLVNMHGGSIHVISDVGCGSEFVIELPADTIEENIEASQLQQQANVEKINIEFSDIYF